MRVNKQWAGVQWGRTAVYALGAPADVAVRAVWGLGKAQGPQTLVESLTWQDNRLDILDVLFSAKGQHRLAQQPLGLAALGHLCLVVCLLVSRVSAWSVLPLLLRLELTERSWAGHRIYLRS
jgi:hypothetical protein